MSVTKDGLTLTIYDNSADNPQEISSCQSEIGRWAFPVVVEGSRMCYNASCVVSRDGNTIYTDSNPQRLDDSKSARFWCEIPISTVIDSFSSTFIISVTVPKDGEYPQRTITIPLAVIVQDYTMGYPGISFDSGDYWAPLGNNTVYEKIFNDKIRFRDPKTMYGAYITERTIGFFDTTAGEDSISYLPALYDNNGLYYKTPSLSAGTYYFLISCRDSRGKGSHIYLYITVNEYSYPIVSFLSLYRCTPEGLHDDENGTCLYYNISYSLTNDKTVLADKQLTLYWKAALEATYSSIDIPIDTFSGTTSGIIDDEIFSGEENYRVYATLSDAFRATSTGVNIVPAYSVLLDFRSDGKGFSVGKIATSQTDPMVEIAWPSRFYDTATFQKGDAWIGPRCVRSIDGKNYRAEIGVGADKSAALEFAPVNDVVKNRIDLFADRTELAQPLIASGGGTGRKSLTSGYFLRGNGTDAVTLSSPSDALKAMGGALGGTGYVDDLDTCYYRGLYACNPSTKNTPTGYYGACVNIPFHVNGYSIGDCKQLFIRHGDDKQIWQRTSNNGIWFPWQSNIKSQLTMGLNYRRVVNYSTAWSVETVYLGTYFGSIGDGLDTEMGNYIEVKSDNISNVEVSACVTALISQPSGEFDMVITKNGSVIAGAIAVASSTVVSLCIPPRIITASKGDRFCLQCDWGKTGTITFVENHCMMTVKEV